MSGSDGRLNGSPLWARNRVTNPTDGGDDGPRPIARRSTSETNAPGSLQVSARPGGWLAVRWGGLVADAEPQLLLRGRAWARGGRVRDLVVSPGLATADVADGVVRSVSVRVPSLDARVWARLQRVLCSRLAWVAALIEGELPQAFVEQLDKTGVRLIPNADAIEGDCDCDDWHRPCAHVVAVQLLLAEALDGDPFLLLALRGRTRDELADEIKTAWGDGPIPDPLPAPVAAADGWTRARVGLARLTFSFEEPSTSAAALQALGPGPGGVDLVRALAPLYDAGASVAMAIAHGETPSRTARPRIEPRDDARPVTASDEPRPVRRRRTTPKHDELADDLVHRLGELRCARSQDLAELLDVPVLEVRRQLLDLERLGIVYRTGNTRGTRWWLG